MRSAAVAATDRTARGSATSAHAAGPLVDHIVVGQPGVFVVDSMNLHGSVETTGDCLTLTRPEDTRPVYANDQFASTVHGQAVHIYQLLRVRAGQRLCVTGVVALWADLPQNESAGNRMHFVDGKHLVDWMLKQPPRLSHAEVVEIANSLQPGRRSSR